MEFTEIDGYEEEQDFSIQDALRILSLNSHRNTTRWALVNKSVFTNGRHAYDWSAVEPQYDINDPDFEPNYRMTEFEAVAVAKAYIMENIEAELTSVRGQ